jgi:hypothetical protein
VITLATNVDETILRLELAARQVPAVVDDALDAGAGRLLDELVDRSPRDTGEYADSWRREPAANGVAAVVNDAPHAPYVELDDSGAADEDAIHREIEAGVARLLGA